MFVIITLTLTVVLIALLMQREMISGLDGARIKRMRQALNLIIGPLTIVFLVTVVTKLRAEPRQATNAMPTPTVTAQPTPTTIAALPVAKVKTLIEPAPTASLVPLTIKPTTAPTAAPMLPTAVPVQPTAAATTSFGAPAGGWPLRNAATWSAAQADTGYQLTLNGQPNLSIATALADGDYQLTMDVTVLRGGAGMIFLAENPATFYRLVISNDGAYTLQKIDQANHITTLADWTESAALRQGANASNTLRVERHGDQIQFFANDQQLTTFVVPAGRFFNRYGFALTARSGNAQAVFAHLIGQQNAATK